MHCWECLLSLQRAISTSWRTAVRWIHGLGSPQTAAKGDKKSKFWTGVRPRKDVRRKKLTAGRSCCSVETKVGEKVRIGNGQAWTQMFNRQFIWAPPTRVIVTLLSTGVWRLNWFGNNCFIKPPGHMCGKITQSLWFQGNSEYRTRKPPLPLFESYFILILFFKQCPLTLLRYTSRIPRSTILHSSGCCSLCSLLW